MLLKYYLNELGGNYVPKFLEKYLDDPNLKRLKNVGYFCGMDYASKDIYDFSEYISRFDHSLSVALLTYKLTKDKEKTLAGLFHDIATPCFSHVIDYMNKDYEFQESTEKYTEEILKKDEYLLGCLKEDGIDISNIINFKNYTVVDNDRPKVCADRIDGVILTSIGWTKSITSSDIKDIVSDMCIVKNEFGEDEIAFKSKDVVDKVIDYSRKIDVACHSNEDNYMMELLAKITRHMIDSNYITYDNLYSLDEKQVFDIIKDKSLTDNKLKELFYEFENKKLSDILSFDLPNVKLRKLNPIVNNERVK